MNMSRRWNVLRALLPLLLAAALGMGAPASYAHIGDSATAEPTVIRTPKPTATATPPVGERADSCERNNAREQACQIAVDSVNGPFTFLPPGDQDYYRVDLGAPNGLLTTIAVRSNGSLDLLTTISRDEAAPLTSSCASSVRESQCRSFTIFVGANLFARAETSHAVAE